MRLHLKKAALAVGAATLAVVSNAQAAGPIDDAMTALEGSGTKIAAVAGVLAAISASVMIWSKVRKYFSKSG